MDVASLPKWKCHKVVRAAKIVRMDGNPHGRGSTSDVTLDCGVVTVEAAVFARKMPELGDYLVVYDDGYVSWSPAKAFEDGYTPLTMAGAEGAG